MGKYKFYTPKETNEKILSLLESMDIKVEIVEINNDEQTYSCHIKAYYNNNFIGYSNGKGKNRDYALASGLAEFMERLSNDYLKPPNFTMINEELMKKSFKNFGFNVHNDEKLLNLNEFFSQDIAKEYYKNYGEFTFLPFRHDTIPLNQMKVPCMPYENVLNSSDVQYLPFYGFGCSFVLGSNGMCAGNVFKEAMTEGISELYERNANMSLLMGKYEHCPNIPIEELKDYPEYLEIIHYFEKNGFSFTLKDYSLGGKFPVIGVVLKNLNTGKNYVNVASFPVFHIAVERCFTEIFQNKDISTMDFVMSNDLCFKYNSSGDNLLQITKDGRGIYPEYILYPDNTPYHLEQFLFDKEEKLSIDEIYERVLYFIKENNIRCYYHDASYYGFNAYSILFTNIRNNTVFVTNEDTDAIFAGETQYNTKKISEYFYRNPTGHNISDNIDEIYNLLVKFAKQSNLCSFTFIERYLSYEDRVGISITFTLFLYWCTFAKKLYKECDELLSQSDVDLRAFFATEEYQDYFTASVFITRNAAEGMNEEEIIRQTKLISNLSEDKIITLVKNPLSLLDRLLDKEYYLKDMEQDYLKFVYHLHEKEYEFKQEK